MIESESSGSETPESPDRQTAAASRKNKWRILALLAIATFYFAIPNARPDFTRFNCNDSECYVALSYALSHGLGYTRSMIPGAYVGHTTWPPGVPVLLLPATLVSGDTVNWLLLKWTMALVGILGIVVVWKLAARISGSGSAADWSAAAVALNPFYWDFSHQCMAEAPLTIWVLMSILLADRTWSGRQARGREAVLVGFFAGLGMLFKGHAAGLLLVPFAYLFGKRGTTLHWRGFAASYASYVLGFLIPFIAWGIRNSTVDAPGFDGINQIRMIRAVDPCDPESPMMTTAQSLNVIRSNVLQHIIYRIPCQVVPGLWQDAAWKWKGSGPIFLALMLLIVGLSFGKDSGTLAMLGACAAIGVLNVQYALGGSPRFWVPVSVMLTICITTRLAAIVARQTRPVRSGIAVLCAAALGASFGGYVADHERHPYNPGGWAELAELFQQIATDHEGVSAVVTHNNQAFQLITGIPAPMGVGKSDLAVDHIVLNEKSADSARDKGWREIFCVRPWCLYKLDRPRRVSEISRMIAVPSESSGTIP